MQPGNGAPVIPGGDTLLIPSGTLATYVQTRGLNLHCKAVKFGKR